MMIRAGLEVALAVGLLAAPFAAEAQQTERVHQIGVLSGGKNAQTDACLESLREGLRELGYVEGRTHVLTVRWSEGQDTEFPHLAVDLVNRKVDVIVSLSSGSHPAVKKVTSTIPIVMAASSYPVEAGVIRSLAHPGGNVTGLTGLTPEMIAKRLQLRKEAVPGATRVAILRLPGRLQTAMVKDLTTAGRQLGIELLVLEVQSADDLPSAFAQAANHRVDAVMTTQAPFFAFEATRIAELALKHRLMVARAR